MIRLGGDYLGVEAKGHLRMGMSRLCHDVGHIGPCCEQEGMKVRRSECGVTSGIGSRPAARRSTLANFAADGGHENLPIGGHGNSPLADAEPPQWRPSDLPTRN